VSVAAKKWVRKHSPTDVFPRRQRASRQAVLLELAWAADDTGHGARLSHAQIVRATELGERTVKRALADLEGAQLIVRHRGGRDHCDACARARRGVVVFDVAIPVAADHDMVNQDQMNLFVAPVNDRGHEEQVGHHGLGTGAMVTPLEEIEEVTSLSLDQVGEEQRQDPASLSEAEPQPAARERTREAPAAKPVSYRGRTVPRPVVATAERLLGVFNDATGGQLAARGRMGQATAALKQIVGALLERPDEPVEVWERGVRSMAADPPSWVETRLMVGHVFGPRAAEHTLARGRGEHAACRPRRRPGPRALSGGVGRDRRRA
jgi:hypothetical protein